MKSIGIEITPHGIAVAELVTERTSYSILNGHFFSLNPNDSENWQIDLLQNLKEIKSLYNFESSTVCVSLNQLTASCRNLNFPFSRRLDVLRSLPFELEEELPMSVDDGIFDAKTISISGSETSVLAFAVRREEIEHILSLLEKVQIDPDILSIEGVAFSNLYEDWAEGSFLLSKPETIPDPLQLRLFFRHETTLISLFRGRQMVFVRSLPWGEKNLIQELVKHYNYPYEQAQSLIPQKLKVLVSLSGADAEDIKLSGIIDKTLRPFMHELRMMLIDIEEKFNSPVSDAIVTGKLGQVENINSLFTKHFAIPFNTESLEGDVFSPQQLGFISTDIDKLSIAIGTAIEGFKKPRHPAVNFRQGDLAKRNHVLEKLWSKWNQALILGGILYIALIIYGFTREQIATHLDDAAFTQLQKTAAKIANMPEQKVSAENVQSYIDREYEKQENLKVFEKVQDIEPALKVVETLSMELPSSPLNNYDIRKLDIKYANIIIEGEAQQKDTINLIRKKLEGLAVDKKVHSLNPTLQKGKGTAFAFRIRTKGSL